MTHALNHHSDGYTEEYFLQEFQSFREIMGSTRYTLHQKEMAFKGLFVVVGRSPQTEKVQLAWDLAQREWEMRAPLILRREITKIFEPCSASLRLALRRVGQVPIDNMNPA